MRVTSIAVAILLTFAAAAHAQAGTPVVGGGSFNTAPALKPGKYADTVAAGETVYWKVALQKGQVLRVKATVDTSGIEDDVTKADYLEGLDNLEYSLELDTPLRESVGEVADWRAGSTELHGDSGAGAKTGEVTSPRVFGYEQLLGTDYSEDKFPGPGNWYVALSAADSEIYPAEIPAELPVELEVSIDGTPEPSSANFAAKLPGPTPEPTAEPTTSELAAGDAGAGDPALTIGLVAILALLGGLSLGALATKLLVRP